MGVFIKHHSSLVTSALIYRLASAAAAGGCCPMSHRNYELAVAYRQLCRLLIYHIISDHRIGSSKDRERACSNVVISS